MTSSAVATPVPLPPSTKKAALLTQGLRLFQRSDHELNLWSTKYAQQVTVFIPDRYLNRAPKDVDLHLVGLGNVVGASRHRGGGIPTISSKQYDNLKHFASYWLKIERSYQI